ncbi:odorant receptor 4-like isoform X1 [Harpegnathos saltator]|uniref:odorant receptor 4-like isoform X1 n=2 Tax=Harpegnathos saltator TaxID=610380 RepID=UPI000948F968|nr:odorant receptor 4-like isoform X1 [Harpegnathos saltator]
MPQREKVKMPASVFALSMELGLRYVGMWPDAPCALFCRCVWILTTTIVQTCQYWYLILHFRTEDLLNLTDSLSVALEYTVMFSKLIILWLNSRIFNDVLASMAIDWREAALNDVQIMTGKASLSRYFSNLIIGLHSAAAFSYGLGVLVQSSRSDETNANGVPIREFTLKLQLPFECNQSPRYEVVQCLEFLHQLSASAVTGMLNSLVVTFVLHTCGQIDILCDALKNLSPGKYTHRLTSSVAGELVVRHQKIIDFSDKIERIFCYIALMQFMSSTLVICCLGYMVVTSISNVQDSESVDSPALMKAIIFCMAATVEAFIFCFCGEYLSAKSKIIGDAAYKSLWYDLKPEQNRFILLIMLRSQKRLTITVGKMSDLSLEGFTTIIKASVSYISVLHAMS